VKPNKRKVKQMNYKREIAKLLLQITNDEYLRYIYLFIKGFAKLKPNPAQENKKAA
jgi:hypothetical protein